MYVVIMRYRESAARCTKDKAFADFLFTLTVVNALPFYCTKLKICSYSYGSTGLYIARPKKHVSSG